MENPRGGAELLIAMAAGDHSAWCDLEARFGQQLWSVARACGLNEADTADAVQGTWLRLLEHLSCIREPASIGAWLSTTVRREAMLIARRGGAESALDTASHPCEADPASAILEADEGRLLWQAISTLHEPCRTLLRLVAGDTGNQQLAVRLGVPAGSVGPTKARCLDKLRTLISLEELVP